MNTLRVVRTVSDLRGLEIPFIFGFRSNSVASPTVAFLHDLPYQEISRCCLGDSITASNSSSKTLKSKVIGSQTVIGARWDPRRGGGALRASLGTRAAGTGDQMPDAIAPSQKCRAKSL